MTGIRYVIQCFFRFVARNPLPIPLQLTIHQITVRGHFSRKWRNIQCWYLDHSFLFFVSPLLGGLACIWHKLKTIIISVLSTRVCTFSGNADWTRDDDHTRTCLVLVLSECNGIKCCRWASEAQLHAYVMCDTRCEFTKWQTDFTISFRNHLSSKSTKRWNLSSCVFCFLGPYLATHWATKACLFRARPLHAVRKQNKKALGYW